MRLAVIVTVKIADEKNAHRFPKKECCTLHLHSIQCRGVSASTTTAIITGFARTSNVSGSVSVAQVPHVLTCCVTV